VGSCYEYEVVLIEFQSGGLGYLIKTFFCFPKFDLNRISSDLGRTISAHVVSRCCFL
jgi:hypothetical protein